MKPGYLNLNRSIVKFKGINLILHICTGKFNKYIKFYLLISLYMPTLLFIHLNISQNEYVSMFWRSFTEIVSWKHFKVSQKFSSALPSIANLIFVDRPGSNFCMHR